MPRSRPVTAAVNVAARSFVDSNVAARSFVEFHVKQPLCGPIKGWYLVRHARCGERDPFRTCPCTTGEPTATVDDGA